jgi:hypothetical protein
MNLERGFRRITLVLGIVVGLGAWLLCFAFIFPSWENERSRYSSYKDDYDNIIYFWTVWDANGWSGGKRSVVQHFLDSHNYAPFEIRHESVYLNAEDVFPDIHRDMLNLPLDSLDKKAKTAKEKAFKTIQNKIKSHERWGNKTLAEIICLSILAALPAAVIGFLLVWFLFLVLRWLVRGFSTGTR